MLEENAEIGAGEEVAGGEGPDAVLGGPLNEVVHESGRELTYGDGAVFDFDLAGEDGEGGGGFAVGGAEEEATEDDAILHIDPEKAAAAEVRAALAGDEDVAVIADLHGDAGAGKDFVEGVSEGHVASVMEHAVGDVGVDDVVELAVAVEVAGGRAGELGEEGEGWSGNGIEEQRFVERRRRRERCWRWRRRFRLLLVGWRGRSFLGGGRVGGGDGLRAGTRQAESCGDEDGGQKHSKAANERAKGRHGAPFAGTASRKLYLDPTEWTDTPGRKTQGRLSKTQCMRLLRVVKNSS